MRSRDSIDDLIDRHGPDTIVAAMRPLLTDDRMARIEAVLDARLGGLTVVLENLYDPHNGAAALRSAEAFGLANVHAVESSGAFSASASITIGSDKWLDLHRHKDVAGAAAALRGHGFLLAAAVPSATATLDDVPGEQPLALWFGNEHLGLTPAAISACDLQVGIPMFGFTRSFNLSVSVALLTARAAERRRAALGRAGDLPEEERAYRRARWDAQDNRGAAEIIERYESGRTR